MRGSEIPLQERACAALDQQGICRVELRIRGGRTFVDEADLELVSAYRWRISTDEYGYSYVRTDMRLDGKQRTLLMHRLILGLDFGNPLVGEHHDGNGLNNCRSNLRIATQLQNARHRIRCVNRTGYKGVMWDGWAYRGRFYIDGKRACSKAFPTAEQAAAWYDAMAVERYGEFAHINGVVA